jgi:Deoxynucleoside kinase
MAATDGVLKIAIEGACGAELRLGARLCGREGPGAAGSGARKRRGGRARIWCAGNIGAGKSTLLRLLSGCGMNFVVVPEPISKWTAVEDPDGEDEVDVKVVSASQEDGANLLGRFYAEPRRWSFTFQAYAFLSRVRAQMRPFHEHDQISGAWSRKRFGGAAAGAGAKREREDDAPASADAAGTPPKVARTEDAKQESKDEDDASALKPLRGDESA